MHFISWFVMVGILIGGLISREYMSVMGACVGIGLCAVADSFWYIGKAFHKEESINEESGKD